MPIFLYFLGTVPPERVADAAKEGGQPLPSLHSDHYHPTPEPSIKTGVLTMSIAVLNLTGRSKARTVRSDLIYRVRGRMTR